MDTYPIDVDHYYGLKIGIDSRGNENEVLMIWIQNYTGEKLSLVEVTMQDLLIQWYKMFLELRILHFNIF